MSRIKKFVITDDLLGYTDAILEDDEFADDVNRLFPIKDSEDVVEAFEVMRNIPYNGYSDAEKLYMLDRICKAAIENKVNLEDLIEEVSPGGKTMIDINSAEFKEAVAKDVKIQVDAMMSDLADKDKRAAARQEYENKIKELLGASEKATKDLEILKAEKEKIDQEFVDYKKTVESQAKIQERISALKAGGLELEDWKETEEAVADMSDKAFNLYKNQLTESIKAQKQMMSDEEKKKMMEEQKKKDKAKASTNIVDESKKTGNLPNGEVNEDDNEFPAFAAYLDSNYGTKKVV